MVDTFGELDDVEVDIDEDVFELKIAYDKIFLDCYNTPEGKRLFDTLRERFKEVPIYVKGDTLEATSYRQGMSDLVTMMEKAVEDALNPPRP